MKEQIVANEGQTLYPDIRGGVMPGLEDSAAKIKLVGSDSERAKTGKGEVKTARGKGEGEQRKGVLEEKLKKTKESTEKTKKQAKTAAVRSVQVQPQVEVEVSKLPVPAVPTRDELVIVESYPHIENSKKDLVEVLFERMGVNLDVPGEWDSWNSVQRRQWYEKNGVINTTKLSVEVSSDTSLISNIEVEEGEVSVYKRGEDGYVIGNLHPKQWTCTTFSRIFKRGGVKVDLPEEFDSWITDKKWTFLKEHDVEVIPEAYNQEGRDGEEEPERVYGRERVLEETMNQVNELFTAENLIQQYVNTTDTALRAEIKADIDQLYERVRRAGTNNADYFFVSNFEKMLKRQEVLLKVGGKLNELNVLIPEATRVNIGTIRKSIDREFEKRYKALDTAGRKALFGDIDNYASIQKNLLGYGSLSLNEVQILLLNRAKVLGERLGGQESLLEWRAMTNYEGIERQIEEQRELGIPNDWRDSLRNANNNFRFVESTDAPLSQLQGALNRVVAISENLSQISGMDAAEALAMKEEIDRFKNAVEAKVLQRREMVNSGLDPEKVQPIFNADQWSDTTHRDYYRRFNVDHELNEFKFNGVDKFNLLDKSMQVYFKGFKVEKKMMMNKIEEMSLRDLKVGTTDPDERWIILKFLNKKMTDVNGVDLDQAELDRLWGSLTPADIAEVNRINAEIWGRDGGAMKNVVSEWYQQNLILGAHGVHLVYVLDESGNRVLDESGNPVIKSEEILDTRKKDLKMILKQNLANLKRNTDADYNDWIQKIDEYEKAGLLDQVINVGYHEAWMMGAFSDYDGIRLYDGRPQGRWFGNKQKQAAFVYNTYTSMFFGRMIDHYGEFIQDESRGRPGDVNWLFRKHMLGKRRTVMGHNRLLVKIIADNLIKESEIADKLVLNGRGSFANVLKMKMRTIENVDRLKLGDLDKAPSSIENGYDRGWARGASIEELLDECEISFENIEWSKVFENEKTNFIEYNMIDWWGDRAEGKKFFAAGAMQEYLKNPGTAFFMKMNKDVFYSKREIRIQPWMKLVIPAHQEIGKHWKEWWKLPYDMPHAETERVIDESVRLNMLNYRNVDDLKDELLGWGPFSGAQFLGFIGVRKLRYFAESLDVATRETGKQSWPLIFLWPWEFIKQGFGQAAAQAAGK